MSTTHPTQPDVLPSAVAPQTDSLPVFEGFPNPNAPEINGPVAGFTYQNPPFEGPGTGFARDAQPDYRPRPGRLDINGPTVTLIVGKNIGTRSFHVHANVLTKSSKFLQNAMKAEWNKHQGHISLREETPSLVQVYIEWLYTNKFSVFGLPADLIQLGFPCSSGLAGFYLLGEFLQDFEFQKAILGSMFEACHLPTAKDITSIYEGTPSGSPARRLYVDLFSRHDRSEQFKKDADNLPVEFKNDLCIRLMRRPARRPDTEDYAILDESEAKTSSDRSVRDPSTNTTNRGTSALLDLPQRVERLGRMLDTRRNKRRAQSSLMET